MRTIIVSVLKTDKELHFKVSWILLDAACTWEKAIEYTHWNMVRRTKKKKKDVDSSLV